RARRPRRRARCRRRRLPRQAVRVRRAQRTHPRRPAPSRGPRRAGAFARRRRPRSGAAPRHAQRRAGAAVGARVRRPRGADGAARRGAVALAARGPPLRLGRGDREQRRLGVHPPAEEEARRRLHPQRARRRLLHRRDGAGRRAMSSIRLRLLVSLLALLVLVAAAMAAITYRNVLGETEAIFDYQLQQMALSLRDQGEIASAEAGPLADEQLDFVIQIWTIDGRTIYASRAHASLPARALLGLHTLNVDGRAWRTYSVATRERVIQVAQPVEIRQRLAAHAAWRSVLPLLLMTPFAALAIWWLAAHNLAPLDALARDVRS